MRIATPARVVRDAQTGVRRSALRRDLHAVVSGKSGAVALDLDNTHLDVASVIEEFTFRKSMQSAPVQRLVVALKKNGAADDRKSTRLNSSHRTISYAVFCLKKKKKIKKHSKQ